MDVAMKLINKIGIDDAIKEASENIVKKEIFKISDNFRYENCDEFKPKF